MAKAKVQTITLKVSDNTKEKMVEYFEDKKRPKTPPYAVFQADEMDTVVTLYESGKAVFQGISADIDANIWKETERRLNPNKTVEMKKAGEKKKETKENKSFVYYANTIGSDEVGTGDYFGPIVVSSAYVTKENIPFLENLGVKDSKKMTDEQILKVVPEIIKKIPYSTRILNNRDYNEKHSNEINMNAMKAILHNKVLLDLSEKYQDAKYIVIDQFTSPTSYFKYLATVPVVQKNITFLTKAEDKCLSVACASLISRYAFIKEFDKMSKSVGFMLPKGAGEAADEAAIKIANQSGFDSLIELVKLNFKNTEKIRQQLKISKN